MSTRPPPKSAADAISASDIEAGGGHTSRWNGFSQFHPSNILSHSNSSDDWLDNAENTLRKLTIWLTPSFLQHYVGGEPAEPAKLHAIAALDGLRGWACLLVFNFHFLFTYTWKVAVGWGFAGENFGIHQLPFLHLLISGHIQVAIFFVISGYVLSYKPLKTIRNRQFDQTFTTLASSTFRRGLRLYLPSFVGLLCVFIAARFGLYNYSHGVIKEGHTILGTNEQHPSVYRSFNKQFWDFYKTLAALLNPFDWNLYYNYYNPHLWTIPVEFRCSMVLFVTILATARLVAKIRMPLVACVIWFCMRYGRWDVVLFLFGMLMAEIDLVNGTWERANAPTAAVADDKAHFHVRAGAKVTIRLSRRRLWITLFIVGLFIGSVPNLGFKWTPFYSWLWHLTPKPYPEPHRFPQTIGAVLIVFSINNCPDIQILFVNPFSQYLGKISYAFYIVHGPILHSLGYAIMPSIWRIVGKETDFQYCLGFLIGWSICLPVSIWAGDLFWRAVDVPSVKFARWLENRVIAQSGPSPPPAPPILSAPRTS